MEPTIHCARPAPGCEARVSDFVVTTETTDIKRGDIVVLIAPQSAEQACGFGGRYFKRIIGLPGETWQERDGYVYINGELLDEPYIKDDRRDRESHAKQTIPDRPLLRDGRQPLGVLRLAAMGHRARIEHR